MARVRGHPSSPRQAQAGVAANIIVAQLSTVRAVKWRCEAAVLLMIARRLPQPNSRVFTSSLFLPIFFLFVAVRANTSRAN